MIISDQTTIAVSKRRKILVQRLKNDYYSWCIQYRGNGHYFHSFEAVTAYLAGRFNYYGDIPITCGSDDYSPAIPMHQ